MAHITKSTMINSPPDKVFKALDDPNQMPTIVPAVSRVSDVKLSPRRVGDTFRVTYGLMGMHFDLDFTNVENLPPKKIVRQFEGGMSGKMSYTLEPEGDMTKVSFDVEYQMSGGVLGKAMNRLLVERMNEKNAERMLENLKMLMETKETPVLAPA
jgi:carbon monoxide dehydrogenase subunit G